MEKVSKKIANDLNKKISKLIIVNGGLFKNDTGISEIYNLPTKFGDLYIAINKEHNYCYSVFTRFEEPNLITYKIAQYSPNTHSGKCNFFFPPSELSNAFDCIENYFKNIVK